MEGQLQGVVICFEWPEESMGYANKFAELALCLLTTKQQTSIAFTKS